MPPLLSPIRTFRHPASVEALAHAKADRRVSVCLPARDEQPTVGAIVHTLVEDLGERHRLVDEVIVVDDRSDDGTAAAAADAGARVLPGPGRGKGAAMQLGLRESHGDIVAFCDADLRHFDAGLVVALLAPLLADGSGIDFVKGFYDRPYEGQWGEGGRVTELVAKPLLRTLFPHLAGLRQPLAGECCGRREVLERVPFVAGYGVDIGLVIDVAARFGTGPLVQADLGRRVHRNRPLAELAPQAEAVLRTALARAGMGDPVPECPSLAG
jgi:glucosyl-3-phosphoglycerate synthase